MVDSAFACATAGITSATAGAERAAGVTACGTADVDEDHRNVDAGAGVKALIVEAVTAVPGAAATAGVDPITATGAEMEPTGTATLVTCEMARSCGIVGDCRCGKEGC